MNQRHATPPEDNDTEIQRLWNELNDLRAEQKLLSIREDDVLSRLQDAVGYKGKPTQSSLPKSQKIPRWAGSVDDNGPDNDTYRLGKRARKSSQP
ncbi:hypothetical protein J4E91_011257 [Alternaria rosae]|nr:hypothetical protein J4E91_011257 [Alternaria rosae]